MDRITVPAILLIFSPFVLFLLLQIVVWIYCFMRYGDPMYETPPPEWDRTRVVYITEEKKRKKKECPICKRPTRCRVSPPNSRLPYHIIRD